MIGRRREGLETFYSEYQLVRERRLLPEPDDAHPGLILDDLMAVVAELLHPFAGKRSNRQKVCLAVPLTVCEHFEELGVYRHLSPFLNPGAGA
jgi:hypothetical protein